MSPRRVLAVVAVGALTLALAACDPGRDEPTAAPSPSTTTATPEPTTSAPPTEEPTSAASEVPPPNPADFPGMDQQTEEGAKQAFRYFWASAVVGYRSGNSALLRDVSSESCTYCSQEIGTIEKNSSAGKFWGNAEISTTTLVTHSYTDTESVVIYDFSLSEHEERDSASASPSAISAANYRTTGKLEWSGGKWRVSAVDIDS